MKMYKKFFATFILVVCFLSPFQAFAAEGMALTKSDGKTEARFRYFREDDSYIKNDWKQVNDKWFYFGDDGITIQKAWAEINGKWYYFDEWSVMLHDTVTPDGYTVGSDGAWITE